MYGFLDPIPTSTMLPSMEAIAYQVNSVLGKELTAVFQDVIDYRDNLDYNNVVLTEQAKRTYRIKKVHEYCKKEMGPKFIKVIESKTGLKVGKLYLVGGINNDCHNYFAVDLSFGHVGASLETMERITGTDNRKYTKDREVVDIFKSMAENIDLKTCKLKSSNLRRGFKLSVDLYFDTNTAFLVEDFLVKSEAPPLTADEIASIMMHEIGHAFTIIEHSAEMFVNHQLLDNFSADLSNRSDLGNVFKLMENDLLPILKKLGTGIHEQKVYNTIRKALDTAYKYHQDEAGALTEGSLIIFKNIIRLIFCIMSQFLGYITVTHCIHALISSQYLDDTITGKKASDIRINHNNTFLSERWADEFVARHGYGSQLASALNKITIYGDSFIGTVTNHRLRNSTFFNCVCQGYSWLNQKLGVFNYLDPIGYENNYNRNVRILQNTYSMFRQEKIDGQVVDQWIRNVEMLDKQIKASKTLSDTEFGKAVYNTIHNLIDPLRWYTLLKNGGLDRDTEILTNRLDAMRYNSLYYLSHKLKG